MAEKVFAKGIKFFDKLASQPDFVLGSVVLTFDDIKEMFKENEEFLTEYNGKKQLRLKHLKGRDGKPYLEVDTYKKPGAAAAAPVASSAPYDNSDLPF